MYHFIYIIFIHFHFRKFDNSRQWNILYRIRFEKNLLEDFVPIREVPYARRIQILNEVDVSAEILPIVTPNLDASNSLKKKNTPEIRLNTFVT